MNTSNSSPNAGKWAVVDDDPRMLELYPMLLEGAVPNEVVCFEDPVDALAAIATEADDFDVLITDRQMPRLDGVSLLVLLRELAPGLRFVIATGNPQDLAGELKLHGLPRSWISKPFDLPRLMQAVDEAPRLLEERAYAPISGSVTFTTS